MINGLFPLADELSQSTTTIVTIDELDDVLLTFFVTLYKMSGNIQHDLKVVKHQDEAPPAQGHPPREAVSHKAAGTFP